MFPQNLFCRTYRSSFRVIVAIRQLPARVAPFSSSSVITSGVNNQNLNVTRRGAQLRPIDFRCLKSLGGLGGRRDIATSTSRTMAAPMTKEVINGDEGKVETLQESVTVIRYKPGEERFQMQITLNNGKVFNFDRKCSDSVSSVETRIATNVTKKVKKFEGVVKFILGDSEESQGAKEGEEEVPIEQVLTSALKSPSQSLKLQVGEDIYEVVFNPPEVFAIKFFNTYMPTFPLFPYRMETSENFCKEESLYKWEFSKEKPETSKFPKSKKSSSGTDLPNSTPDSGWTVCGRDIHFTPEKGMEGGYLRFTCTPSNGTNFGKPFSMTLSHPITELPVDSFLFQERLSRLATKPSDPDFLRIVTYNILADTYATPEWFVSSPRESLDVGYRLPILNREIEAYQADLICLQEVDEKYFEGNFLPYLTAKGYSALHTCKVGNTKEGIATFHNPSKLTLIAFHECVILEHMKTLFLWKNLKAVGPDFVERLEDRNTVFQVSVFKAKHSNVILLVGNVHLYFHPDADHIRLLQTITCINYLESKLAQYKSEHPNDKVAVIFCGDLNCTPPFSSYRLLTTGKVEDFDEDWSSHSEEKIVPGISFAHSLNLTNSHPGEELTNITTAFEGCLDYILYQSEHFQLCQTYPPPSKEELAVLMKIDEARKVSLPNFYTPSDHLPLIADLKIKS